MDVVEYTHIGRRCVVTGITRVRHKNRAWGYHDVLSIRYLDETGRITSCEIIPAGRFNRKALATGRKLIYVGPDGYREAP